MALRKPSPEDLRKINAEINQLVNQRFLLTTLAISVFGVVFAWLIPKSPPTPGADIGAFTVAATTLLLLLLFLLHLFSHLLRGMLRVYSTYLIVTGTSGWEKDWEEYRTKNYWAYTKPQSLVFMVIGMLAVLFPPALALCFSLRWQPVIGLGILGAFWCLYELLIYLMGFHDLWSTEKAAMVRWRDLSK